MYKENHKWLSMMTRPLKNKENYIWENLVTNPQVEENWRGGGCTLGWPEKRKKKRIHYEILYFTLFTEFLMVFMLRLLWLVRVVYLYFQAYGLWSIEEWVNLSALMIPHLIWKSTTSWQESVYFSLMRIVAF